MRAVSEYMQWWDGDGTLSPSEVALGLRLAGAAIAELQAENAELRKQNEILATTRRLEEAARRCEGLKEAVREALYKQSPWSVSTHDGNRTFIDLVFAADAVGRSLDRWAERVTP